MKKAPALIPILLLSTGCGPESPDTSPGVSWELAEHRRERISDIRYGLTLSIPRAIDERIRGVESIHFALSDNHTPIVLDFRADPADIIQVYAFNDSVDFEVVNDHIVIPGSPFEEGQNLIQIEFLAGDLSLNRNPDFLYTLFVPDRAATAFPSFDQPNMKASYQLTLTTPASWRAVANGTLVRADTIEGTITWTFAETKPLSTYQFSFAAGEFMVETGVRDGRTMHMYHRETDDAKVQRNREAVFDLHATALSWLEEYTGIPYPFGKFDFVLIPAFQYGGMEHPGAILYRSSSLLLDETATQNQKLGRASVISHETTHMWFGDMVTMNWFDDVWTKEVFANFMAAKIINPSFPNIDHDLRFFLAHYPAAYGVDRTTGANAIRQPLENLKDAGTLYGAIIYQKAPIVMRQLEQITGPDVFRSGMREYLTDFRYGNATWPDLVARLDGRTDEDLRSWSEVWVQEPGRPTISTELSADDSGRITSLRVLQKDPSGTGRIWRQQLEVTLGRGGQVTTIPVYMNGPTIDVDQAVGTAQPDYVLATGKGGAYGLFELDSKSRDYLLQHISEIPDPITRAAGWITLWDDMLQENIAPAALLSLAISALPSEQNELIVQRILGYVRTAYWQFSNTIDRERLVPALEQLLWRSMENASGTSLKATYFNAYRSIAITQAGVDKLLGIWNRDIEIRGLPLSERDYSAIAQDLALREIPNAEQILADQAKRIRNPDRRSRFEFAIPALSPQQSVRDEFFESLKKAKNREHEPWVLSAVSLLHHPLRANESEKYIRPSLMLLEEIQETGDIFFPKRWLDATLSGHSSESAAGAVRDFLEGRPDYPIRLRQKIEQSADGLFRAAHILHAKLASSGEDR